MTGGRRPGARPGTGSEQMASEQMGDEQMGDEPRAAAPVRGRSPGLGRRSFLKEAVAGGAGLAALGAAGAALRASRPAAAAATTSSQAPAGGAGHQWGFVLDLRYCNGCELCTTACEKYHYLHEDQTWIKVFTMVSASGESYYMPRPCQMCEDPPCVPVCPVSANVRTSEGITLVDQSRCIGTRICMNACPYEARYFNWTDPVSAPRQPFPQQPTWPVPQVKGTVGKCITCAAMLPEGKLPECVAYCPMGVIYLADLAADTAVNGQGKTVRLSKFLADNDAVKFKESAGTNPRTWYILGHGQDVDNDAEAG